MVRPDGQLEAVLRPRRFASFVLRHLPARPALSTNTSTLLTVLAKRFVWPPMINQRGRRRRPPPGDAAASALAWLRHAQTTSWPAFASIFAPSSPTPEFAPVTMMLFLGDFSRGLEQLGLGHDVCPRGLAERVRSGRRPAAPSVSRRSRRPRSALAGASTGRAGGVRWAPGASACTAATESTAATRRILQGCCRDFAAARGMAVAKCVPHRTQL